MPLPIESRGGRARVGPVSGKAPLARPFCLEVASKVLRRHAIEKLHSHHHDIRFGRHPDHRTRLPCRNLHAQDRGDSAFSTVVRMVAIRDPHVISKH